MKTLLERTEGINFRKVFTVFFAALLGFVMIYIVFMMANGYWGELSRLWERVTFTRVRGRMFTDILVTFRFLSYLFIVGFNAILALWVYADSKKLGNYKVFWPALTLFTGLIGCLMYLIGRVDKEENVIN